MSIMIWGVCVCMWESKDSSLQWVYSFDLYVGSEVEPRSQDLPSKHFIHSVT